MKVLQVISNLAVGGAETMLLKLVSTLRPPAHEFQVVSLTGDGPVGERIRAVGVPTAFLGMARGQPNPLRAAGLLRIIRAFRPDLIQTWMYHADLIGGLCGRLAGVPVIWGIRNSELDPVGSKRTTYWTRAACARLSRLLPASIVSCSRTAAALHVGLGYPAERLVTIPNGFDVEAFAPSPEARRAVRAELGVPEEAPLVGMVARFDPQKDHPNFFRAAEALLGRRPDCRFLLCGLDVDRRNPVLAGLVRASRAPDAFRLLGRRDDVARIDAALDVATLSSSAEGFPNAIGEAMACGVPCAVTDVGDSGWLVGSTGRTVPPRDPERLAAAWEELLALPPGERAALGQAARERIAATFSIGAVAQEFAALYRRVRPGA